MHVCVLCVCGDHRQMIYKSSPLLIGSPLTLALSAAIRIRNSSPARHRLRIRARRLRDCDSEFSHMLVRTRKQVEHACVCACVRMCGTPNNTFDLNKLNFSSFGCLLFDDLVTRPENLICPSDTHTGKRMRVLRMAYCCCQTARTHLYRACEPLISHQARRSAGREVGSQSRSGAAIARCLSFNLHTLARTHARARVEREYPLLSCFFSVLFPASLWALYLRVIIYIL